MLDNICLLTDSYKISHYKQYPPGTTHIYSYFESRGGRYDSTLFFGLQYYLKRYFAGRVVTQEKIEQAVELLTLHFGADVFYRDGWEYIVREHDGRLPVRIKAVPEGSLIPLHNVLMTIENTDPNCYWLTNYLETLLVQVWYATTVATQSHAMKQRLLAYLHKTGDPELALFKLHDFGFRGVSSVETAAMGACADLVNFRGTDTLAGLVLAREYYGEPIAGFSIPASEHSTITAWGPDHELDAMRNMLEQYPTGLVACVSDSFDIFRACADYWGTQLREQVLSRDGTLVIRPDSGDPPEIVVKVLEILGEKFGCEKNAKGYRVLNPKVRVLQGDGIDPAMLEKVLAAVEQHGWSADNVSFGSGGGLLQKLNRDTQKFAFKCSAAVVDGQPRDVYKDPVTDHGKKSKRGRLKLVRATGGQGRQFQTVLADEPGDDLLQTVFENGRLLVEHDFAGIRKRAEVDVT